MSRAAAIHRDVVASLARPWRRYAPFLALCAALFAIGVFSFSRLVTRGFYLTGLDQPVMWGLLIAGFVFWVGIAHSGTLISAILFLFRARFRTATARIAEAMTVFAVMTAGLFPLMHLGRAWLAFWMLPYPNGRQLWPNFRSPLAWDVFAVATYLVVSVLFLTTGIIPDAASLRAGARGPRRWLYSLLSFGFAGSAGEWRRYARGYLFFAAIATPLVISVHSVVSWDFAMTQNPGWHSTLFAPYFVAGAIFSGVAMVITLLVPLRRALGLSAYITGEHFDKLARLLVFTSLIVSYSYAVELLSAVIGPSGAERAIYAYRAFGPYAPLYWTMIACNSVLPLLCLSRRVRASVPLLFGISLCVNVGMFLERFVIVVTSLAHGYDPAAWGRYRPAPVEYGLLLGSFGWFGLWLLLFTKLLPSVALSELKADALEEA